jgi:hypothetical protein
VLVTVAGFFSRTRGQPGPHSRGFGLAMVFVLLTWRWNDAASSLPRSEGERNIVRSLVRLAIVALLILVSYAYLVGMGVTDSADLI